MLLTLPHRHFQQGGEEPQCDPLKALGMSTPWHVQGSDSKALEVHSDTPFSETSSGSLGTILRSSLFADCCLGSAAEELWSLECV